MAGVGAGSAYAVSLAPNLESLYHALLHPPSDRHCRRSKGILQSDNPFCLCVSPSARLFASIDQFHETDQWLLVMSTQLIGFSIGGICKRFLVAPPSMIWPANLVTAALFNTLHSQETSGTQARSGISRERFFVYVFFGYIVYSQHLFRLGHHCIIILICLSLT